MRQIIITITSCLPLLFLDARLFAQFQIADIGSLPGFANSTASAINNTGQVAGHSYNGSLTSGSQAFLASNGTLTSLGSVSGANSRSFAYGINASAQVTGSTDSSTVTNAQAYLATAGSFTVLANPSGSTGLYYNQAQDINDSGSIVGYTTNSFSSANAAYVYQGGNYTLLNAALGTTNARAFGINSSGQVVGDYVTSSTQRAFLLTNGVVANLGVLPGHTSSSAADVNNLGVAVGNSQGATFFTTSRAFLHDGNAMQDLGTLPGMTYSTASAINDSNWVVGWSGISGSRHAFLYHDGSIYDLNDLIPANSGWTLSFATDINNSGQIVGGGILNGQERGFVLTLTIVPEPSLFLPVAMPSLILFLARRRFSIPQPTTQNSRQ